MCLIIFLILALPGPICDDECREPQHIWGKWGAAKTSEDFFYKKPFFFLIIKYLLLVDHRATEVAILSVLVCTKMICCMALIMLFSIKHYNSDRPTILLASFGLIENGAGEGNRTLLSCLEGRRTSRCTTPANAVD